MSEPSRIARGDDYVRWTRDARLLADIGRLTLEDAGPVRVPIALAIDAIAAWKRDDEGDAFADETTDEAEVRDMAATLALMGLRMSYEQMEGRADIALEIRPHEAVVLALAVERFG